MGTHIVASVHRRNRRVREHREITLARLDHPRACQADRVVLREGAIRL